VLAAAWNPVVKNGHPFPGWLLKTMSTPLSLKALRPVHKPFSFHLQSFFCSFFSDKELLTGILPVVGS
jgi:hypothetical protein